jgi:hypothetical protein
MNNSIVDTWESRIDQAAKVMGIPIEKVEEILKSPGFEITKEPCGLEMLSDESVTPFGDLRKLFCEDNKIAVPKLRMAIKFLRGNKAEDKSKTDVIDPDLMALQAKYGISLRYRFDDLPVEDLIPLYKPNKNNKITEILRKRFGNKKIIAFKPDSNELAVEETINYLADLEAAYPEEESIEVDGELVRLYPIGQLPNQLVAEDPCYNGMPLKRDRSMANRINWSGIPFETRQFFRVLINNVEVKPDDRLNLSNLIKKTINELKSMFPETYMKFKELKAKDELPKLQISITEAAIKKNNPFAVNRAY